MSDRFLMQAHVFPGLLAFTHFINGKGTSDPLVVRWPLPASVLVQRLKEIDWDDLNYDITDERLAKICDLGSGKRTWFAQADTLDFGNLTGQIALLELRPTVRVSGGWYTTTAEVLTEGAIDFSDFAERFVVSLKTVPKGIHGSTFCWAEEDPGVSIDSFLVNDPRVPLAVPVKKKRGREVVVSPVEGFGYKVVWLAIRCEDARQIAGAYSRKPKSADFAAGVAAVERRGVNPPEVPVFTVGPVDGWVLSVFGGFAMARLDFPAIAGMFSSMVGETQVFVNFPNAGVFGWERWVDGELVRRWTNDGDEFGVASPVELVVLADPKGVDEDSVLQVAGAWSVDPMELGERGGVPQTGFVCAAD